MADDSWDVEQFMDFYPYDKPHGMKDYVRPDLTEEQVEKLEEYKTRQIRNDQTYLKEHPEIRGIIIMILRQIMTSKPKLNIYETIGEYFLKPSEDIREEVYSYIANREDIISVPSFVSPEPTLEDEEPSESLNAEEEEEENAEEEDENAAEVVETPDLDVAEDKEATDVEKMCTNILSDILEMVFDEVAFSLGSMSGGLPVDYEDHAMVSSALSLEMTEDY